MNPRLHMPQTIREHALLTRMLLGNAALAGVAVVAMAILLLFAVRSAFHQQLLHRAEAVTEFLAAQCQYPLLIADRNALDQIARSALEGDDVLYVSIAEAGAGSKAESKRPEVRAIPASTPETRAERLVPAAAENAVEVTRPVAAPKSDAMFDWDKSAPAQTTLGTVRIGFSTRRQTALFRRFLWYAALVTLVLPAIVWPLQFWDLERTLSPLGELIHFTRKIGSGDLSGRATVVRRDELGELTVAFNQMVEQLTSTTVSRNYVDDIIQSMAESLIVVDTKRRIQTVNRATLDMLGYTEAELRGQTARMVRKPGGQVPRWAESNLNSGYCAYRSKSGKEIPVLFSSSVLRTSQGDYQGMVWLAQDVTEKLRAQQELVLAKEAAEQASKAKSMFLAGMSHELRTPLNAILGFTQLLRAEMADRGMHSWEDDLQKIGRSGTHLLALINNILDYSKIDAGKMRLELEDFEISVVVGDVAASMEPLAAKNGNEIRVACEPAILRGDAMRVQQCLINLVGNACKFTHQGRVLVEGQPDGGVGSIWYRLQVRDTGIGIAPENMSSLFTAFSQGDPSLSRKYGGSGLGLVITKELCRMMSGDVTVESVPGHGSTFTMRIPVATPPADGATGPLTEKAFEVSFVHG